MSRAVSGVEAAAVADWAKDAGDRAVAPWLRWTGPILSIAVIIVVARVLGRADPIVLGQLLPTSIFFWLGMALLLAIQPIADYAIFRGLWPLPLGGGLLALFRKSASNELLFGYSGELQFYLWARRNAAIPGSPFGAVRDVAVLSALTGNIVTLGLLLAAIALPGPLEFGAMNTPVLWSGVILVASSMVVMLFRHRLFAVSRAQFWRIAAIHTARSIAVTLMFGVLWAMVMPGGSLGGWLLLSAARQFVTRLPFLPNKDLVFAGLAAGMLHNVPDVADTVALVAGIVFAGQVVIGAALAVTDLVREALNVEAR
ncbi:MAG TPA: hypothetical protein VF485_00460 [Sphingomonas sp.]